MSVLNFVSLKTKDGSSLGAYDSRIYDGTVTFHEEAQVFV